MSYVDIDPEMLEDLADTIDSAARSLVAACKALEASNERLRSGLDPGTYAMIDSLLSKISPPVHDAVNHVKILTPRMREYAAAVRQVRKDATG